MIGGKRVVLEGLIVPRRAPYGPAPFEDFQQHLERAVGLPTWTRRGIHGFPTFRWAYRELKLCTL